MKTWKQFNEDVQSYAKDKDAYDKSVASKAKLEARRRDAINRSKKNPKKFAKKSELVHSSELEKADSLKGDYNSQKNSLRSAEQKNVAYRNKIRNRYNNSSGSSKQLYRGTKKVVKKIKGIVDNIRQRQSQN